MTLNHVSDFYWVDRRQSGGSRRHFADPPVPAVTWHLVV